MVLVVSLVCLLTCSNDKDAIYWPFPPFKHIQSILASMAYASGVFLPQKFEIHSSQVFVQV